MILVNSGPVRRAANWAATLPGKTGGNVGYHDNHSFGGQTQTAVFRGPSSPNFQLGVGPIPPNPNSYFKILDWPLLITGIFTVVKTAPRHIRLGPEATTQTLHSDTRLDIDHQVEFASLQSVPDAPDRSTI